MIKLLLNGTRRRLGDYCEQKLPLTPTQLFLTYSRVDLSARPNHAMWCGLVFFVFFVFFHFYGRVKLSRTALFPQNMCYAVGRYLSLRMGYF